MEHLRQNTMQLTNALIVKLARKLIHSPMPGHLLVHRVSLEKLPAFQQVHALFAVLANFQPNLMLPPALTAAQEPTTT
jgi:hypothetical protein